MDCRCGLSLYWLLLSVFHTISATCLTSGLTAKPESGSFLAAASSAGSQKPSMMLANFVCSASTTCHSSGGSTFMSHGLCDGVDDDEEDAEAVVEDGSAMTGAFLVAVHWCSSAPITMERSARSGSVASSCAEKKFATSLRVARGKNEAEDGPSTVDVMAEGHSGIAIFPTSSSSSLHLFVLAPGFKCDGGGVVFVVEQKMVQKRVTTDSLSLSHTLSLVSYRLVLLVLHCSVG